MSPTTHHPSGQELTMTSLQSGFNSPWCRLVRIAVCLVLLSQHVFFGPNVSSAFSFTQGTAAFGYYAIRKSQIPFRKRSVNMVSTDNNNHDIEEEVNENDPEWLKAELVDDAEFYGEDHEDDDEEWMPDREIAKQRKAASQAYYQSAAANPARMPQDGSKKTTTSSKPDDLLQQEEKKETRKKDFKYTEEEEELIAAMGGKFKDGPNNKRQPGYLGDCTLQEIAQDYSVPMCYLADVLTMWGVPVPINVHDRLGDLVTGEQAFAILEALHSLDIASLHDRYSNMNLVDLCDWTGIDLKEAFEMAMKEGWSLPFGVQTCLRVEQEDELVRTLGSVV